MDDTLHYLIMANQMLVQKALLEQLKNTGLTIGHKTPFSELCV